MIDAGGISKFRSDRQASLEEWKARASGLESQLTAAVPEELTKFFSEAMIIPDLVQYGQSSRKFRNEDSKIYSYAGLKDLEGRLERLKTSWGGIVKIEIFHDGDRIEVLFTAV